MDPQCLPGEFSPARPGDRAREIPSGLARVRPASARRVHFLRVESHDRFRGGHEPGGKVARRLRVASVTARRGGHAGWGSRTQSRAPSASGRPGEFDLGALLAVRCNRLPWKGPSAGGCLGSVANRSVLHPTRLETRTKESNMCASHGALSKLKGAMKVKAASGLPRQDPASSAGWAHCRPVSTASSARRSKSAHVGTRKMVNYA